MSDNPLSLVPCVPCPWLSQTGSSFLRQARSRALGIHRVSLEGFLPKHPLPWEAPVGPAVLGPSHPSHRAQRPQPSSACVEYACAPITPECPSRKLPSLARTLLPTACHSPAVFINQLARQLPREGRLFLAILPPALLPGTPRPDFTPAKVPPA